MLGRDDADIADRRGLLMQISLDKDQAVVARSWEPKCDILLIAEAEIAAIRVLSDKLSFAKAQAVFAQCCAFQSVILGRAEDAIA